MNIRKPKLLALDALTNYAAMALAARSQSSSELRNRLKRRAENPEDIDTVIAKMKDVGFLNDAKFADSFANWRKENQGFGKTRVMRDLMTRRVAPALAKQAVETVFEGADEITMIQDYLTRKYRGKDLGALLQEEKNLASAFRKLRGAGFSTSNSIKVLKRYAAEADRLEEMEDETRE